MLLLALKGRVDDRARQSSDQNACALPFVVAMRPLWLVAVAENAREDPVQKNPTERVRPDCLILEREGRTAARSRSRLQCLAGPASVGDLLRWPRPPPGLSALLSSLQRSQPLPQPCPRGASQVAPPVSRVLSAPLRPRARASPSRGGLQGQQPPVSSVPERRRIPKDAGRCRPAPGLQRRLLLRASMPWLPPRVRRPPSSRRPAWPATAWASRRLSQRAGRRSRQEGLPMQKAATCQTSSRRRVDRRGFRCMGLKGSHGSRPRHQPSPRTLSPRTHISGGAGFGLCGGHRDG